MGKYIDAEHLRKEVKRLEKAAHKSALGCADRETRKFHEGKDYAYQHVGILIDSLQQEHQEVDLDENTMKKEFRMIDSACLLFNYDKLSREQLIARRFYLLGLKAGKEERK